MQNTSRMIRMDEGVHENAEFQRFLQGCGDKAFPLNRSLPVNWGWWPKLLQCSAVLGCLAKLMGCLFLKAKGVCVVSGFSLSRFDIRVIYSKSSDQWCRRTLRSFPTCYGIFKSTGCRNPAAMLLGCHLLSRHQWHKWHPKKNSSRQAM